MEYTAVAKSVRMGPRKVRLIADSIRKIDSIDKSLITLPLLKKRAANPIEKTLKSAVANAINRGAKKEDLFIKSIEIMEGPALKRFRPSTRGRTHPYKKRSSHIKIVLTDDKIQNSIRQLADKIQNSAMKGAKRGTKN
ncbi:MAG: 50S ribosomal protein L22 [Candidatus Levybacteria bacterium RIFCSPLOWO2_01_FULL_38_21]|nr:MAG: 50S ribosomal protein L22 [Candidatus Levybacteria bacterium RIFCSPLOWO2_01_FULL_38_21]